MPAVPMNHLPRIRATRRLLPLMLGFALPLAGCSHGKIGEDFCISCAGENHAEAGAPGANATGSHGISGPRSADSQGPAAPGTPRM
ncbi:hypothetical protein [Komagataeibacter diospyri]|uniref:Uncharacterized protein n=1 Tax=Komagataeibacter diospyri TaxID=1932662 RepID=A0A4P5NM58_9PROT|nr:hypothetical protein [Komagataeibacter diospyri]GCE82453.1 hypothetical protein MSKU9_0594 [Komagataeibacter diospyri]